MEPWASREDMRCVRAAAECSLANARLVEIESACGESKVFAVAVGQVGQFNGAPDFVTDAKATT